MSICTAFISKFGLDPEAHSMGTTNPTGQGAQAVEEKLSELSAALERAVRSQEPATEETFTPQEPEEDRLDTEDERRIEQLFKQARLDRSKAYELKRELDRIGVFREYEDRFLDLFKKPD